MQLKSFLFVLVCAVILAPEAGSQTITFDQADRLNPYYPFTMTKADLNRDGYPDLMFSLPSSLNIYTLMSSGGNYVNWTIPTSYCPSTPIGVGDFQRDGTQNILVGYPTLLTGPCGKTTSQGATFAEYSNNGSAIFNKYATLQGESVAAVVADFNGDGKLDIVAYNGNIGLYYGSGYGHFSSMYKIATVAGNVPSIGFPLVAGDFDGNGCPDVAWLEQTGGNPDPLKTALKVAYGNCKGSFTVLTQFSGSVLMNSLHVSDLNRDSVTDLLATYSTDAPGAGILIFYGNKNRSFVRKTITDNEASDPLEVADLNGDGYPEIAYFDYVNGASVPPTSTTMVIRKGDATQTFATQTFYPFGQNSVDQILAGDFNRDGKQDLAVLYGGPTIPSTQKAFSFLYNTTAYPNGACVVPAGPGINICSPGATSTSAVKVLATANVDNPAVYIELWVDGRRVIGYGSTNELRTSLTLPPGSHTLGFVAIDAAGIKITKSKVVTVQ